ncbi:MAG: IMP cyclohydrolase [Kiritimatiellia bacterium]
MAVDLKTAYKTVMDDHFSPTMEISFIDGDTRQTLLYEKVIWSIGGICKGLRYGENPGQEAAMYRLINGNLTLGNVTTVQPGRALVTDAELLQFGKHPGKINLTDADNALNILRFLSATPCAVIVKHNNPCGVAKGSTIAEAYDRANKADLLAAFGGCIALNRKVDKETAELITQNYAEVVVAPDFSADALALFATKKNLRVMRIHTMERLETYATERFLDFKSMLDGGLIAQWSFLPEARTADHLIVPEVTDKQGVVHKIIRTATPQEIEDLLFGWLVESGVTSNSVLYIKDGVTVGIGTGEQDRVGVAEIARDKAYRKLADRHAHEIFNVAYNELPTDAQRAECDAFSAATHGGLQGACMISDAFFPFRDGAEVGIKEGVTAIIQPGGAIRDWDVIDCCNDAGVAMVFTGQRSFRH